MGKEEDNQEGLDLLSQYKKYAIGSLAIALIIFLFLSTGPGVTIKYVPNLGAVGDFFGGILNPIFALIALFALLKTIKLQTKEFKKTAKSLEEQSKSIKQQNFENTYFNLIKLHNEIIDNLHLEKTPLQEAPTNDPAKALIIRRRNKRISEIPQKDKLENDKDYHGKKVLKRICEIIDFSYQQSENKNKEFNKFYNQFHDEHQELLGHYFGIIYQILKFINDESCLTKKKKKKYAHIFRAQFSKNELKILFYHCTGEIGSGKFSKYIEEYEFFEHLPFEFDNMNFHFILKKDFYKAKAFGENLTWKEQIKTAKVVQELK